MSLQTATEKALELEREAGLSASYHELAEVFRKIAPELDPADPRAEFLTWESWLYQYQLKSPSPDGARSDEFGAFMEFSDGRRHPPRVSDFPADATEYFRHRLQAAECPSARARLADFLWLRTRELPMAERAIAEYLGAAQAVFPSQFGAMVATEYVIRAGALSRGLGLHGADVRAAIRHLADALLLLSDRSGFLCILTRETAREIVQDAELAECLLQALIRLADEAAAGGGQQRFSERSLVTTAAEVAAAKKDPELVKRLRRRAASSFEREAEERAGEAPLILAALLQDAMKVYADLGMSAELQQVKSKVHDASERASTDLKEVSTQVTIPTNQLRLDMQKLVDIGRQRTPWLHLQLFAARGLWPDWAAVATRTADLERKFPLQSLVRKVVLGPDGRPLPRPSDPAVARQFDEIQRYVEDTQLTLGFYLIEIEMLRELDAWNEGLIMQALGSGLLFNADLLAAVHPGVLAYEAGRYWEALHTLVPQIERAIRELAQLFGANVYRFQSGTGEIHWSSLTTLLDLEPVRAVLARIRPDLADELKYLLIDSRGMNLRDDVAHGILRYGPGADTRALLCLLILLTLSLPQMAAAPEEPPQGAAPPAAPPR